SAQLPLPLRAGAGGLPRAARRVHGGPRRGGAPAAPVGLPALSGGHRARVRGRGGGAVRRAHDRLTAAGRGALPGQRGGGEVRRLRRLRHRRPRAGVRRLARGATPGDRQPLAAGLTAARSRQPVAISARPPSTSTCSVWSTPRRTTTVGAPSTCLM